MRQFLIATIALPLQAGLSCLAETYTAYGVGNTSCGAYVEARSNANDQGIDYGMWLTGYLTVINQYRLSDDGMPSILEGTDVQGALLWLENYCRTNPTVSFIDAAARLAMYQLTELYAFGLTTKAEWNIYQLIKEPASPASPTPTIAVRAFAGLRAAGPISVTLAESSRDHTAP
jgi:hypothetical protein